MLHEIRFDCWGFDFGPLDLGFDSICKFSRLDLKLQDLGTKSLDNERICRTCAHVLVGPFPFHKHNNDMASAWERFICNQRVEVPTWVKTQRTWRSHLQVTYQRHFVGQPCRMTIPPCDSWPRSTWAFRQLLPASNTFSVLWEQLFVLAATDYRHLLLSHCCFVCSTDSIRACKVTQTWQTVHTRWKLIKRRLLTGMRFDWDLCTEDLRIRHFFEICDWDLTLKI